MSEFSQSLHLRSTSSDEAVDLLVRAQVPGVVRAPVNGWVTLYPPLFVDVRDGRRKDLDRILALATATPLVLWDYAEDHGMTVDVYRDGRLRAVLDTTWETGEVRYWDHETFVALGLLTPFDVTEIDDWLARCAAGYLVAEKLGLSGYAWVDADRAWQAFEAGRLPPGTRLVRRDGTIATLEAVE